MLGFAVVCEQRISFPKFIFTNYGSVPYEKIFPKFSTDRYRFVKRLSNRYRIDKKLIDSVPNRLRFGESVPNRQTKARRKFVDSVPIRQNLVDSVPNRLRFVESLTNRYRSRPIGSEFRKIFFIGISRVCLRFSRYSIFANCVGIEA